MSAEPKEEILHAEQPANLSEKAAKHAELVDQDVARYADASTGLEIDSETNKRLFWKINKRILVVMLGVSGTIHISSAPTSLSTLALYENNA